MQETPFDFYYASDLPRAVETSRIVLSEARPDAMAKLVLERRLREMAKGAREGFPKSVNYDEALRLRRIKDTSSTTVPLRETEEEAWLRMYSFIRSVVTSGLEKRKTHNDTQPCCHVFCMSHSGILRVFLHRLLGKERLYNHSGAKFDATGLFYLPNTSVTILDVGLRTNNLTSVRDNDQQQPPQQSPDHDLDVDIIQLTLADHLGTYNIAAMAFAE